MLCSIPLPAQEPAPAPPVTPIFPETRATIRTSTSSERTLYRWSVVAVLAANAGDAASSWTKREANPFVAGPNAQYGATSVAIKSGFVGASFVIQHFVLRHHPDMAKRFAWMNFITAGGLGGVIAHNATVR